MKGRFWIVFSVAVTGLAIMWFASIRHANESVITASQSAPKLLGGQESHAIQNESVNKVEEPLQALNLKTQAQVTTLPKLVEINGAEPTSQELAARHRVKQQTVRTTYDALIKELQLSEHDAAQLVDVLSNEQEMMMEIQRGAADKTSRTDQFRNLRANAGAEVLAILGADKYNKYEEYQRTLGEHVAVVQLTNLMASTGGVPLTAKQEKDLFGILVDEKPAPMPALLPSDPQFPNAIAESFRAMEDSNSRILERAQTVLTAEQYESFRVRQQRDIQLRQEAMRKAASEHS